MIWPIAILIAHNIINVFIDAYRITVLDKNIRHGINFIIYGITTALCIWQFHFVFWQAFVFSNLAFFNRQITFDIPLNWKRGKDWDYVSLDRPPKAVMDRIEVAIFGYNGKAPTIIYGICLCITIILFLCIRY